MTAQNPSSARRILSAVAYVAMLVVNALANILPINGRTTGAVSDSYPNLFAPAGLTFAIWGLIYLLLAGYTLYQLGLFQKARSESKSKLFADVDTFYIASSIANALWILSWHYDLLPLSMALMLVILGCLIGIVRRVSREPLAGKDYALVRLPFSVYFGWITVATIANATTLLVSLNWNRFGVSVSVWTVLVIVVGLILSLATILRYRDIAYGLVIVWAYAGIVIKHTSASGFGGQYPEVTVTAVVAIVLLAAAMALVIRRPRVVAAV